MDWILSAELWVNTRILPRDTPKEKRERRAREAVMARSYSRGCVILTVYFSGKMELKRIRRV